MRSMTGLPARLTSSSSSDSVNAIPEVLEEPQVQALEMVQTVPGEDFSLVALPLSFDGERPQVKSAAPRLGQHNARVAKAAE